MPNTVSTPSAFRHSMIASTARMRCTSFQALRERQSSLAAHRRAASQALVRDVDLAGIFLIRPAAPAHLARDRHHEAALVAAAARLVALEAVEDRRDGPDQRRSRADQEPEEEGAALDLPDGSGREAEEEHQDEPLHRGVTLAAQDRHGPEDRHHAEYDDDDPGDRGHDADDDLEEDPG